MALGAFVRRLRDRLFGKRDEGVRARSVSETRRDVRGTRRRVNVEQRRSGKGDERVDADSLLDEWLELDSLTTEAKRGEERFFELLEVYREAPTERREREIERSLERICDRWAAVEEQAARAATHDEDLRRARRSARQAKEAWEDHLEAFDDGVEAFVREGTFDTNSP